MNSVLLHVLSKIDHTVVYRALLIFYGLYPVAMALVWIVLSVFFRYRQEHLIRPAIGTDLPFVSVVIAAFAEEESIAKTLEALLQLDYPHYEVIVVNDGSPDRTSEIVRQFLDRGPFRLINKRINEGKAMALNDALPACRGEILLLLDADVVVTPQLLNYMVPHFRSGRVAAVAGNPRVANRKTFLQTLQAIEFSSIISMQRRAQRIWGRVMTVSGAVVAFRRSALLDVGLFSPDMATEDIDITWRVQMRFWDVRYEPRAVVWMQVPPTLNEWWKQRRRWTRGLAQVLGRHHSVIHSWRLRRLWPIFYESILSILWAHTFILISAYWVCCLIAGYSPYGSSPVPNFWGMTIATACLTQLFVGAIADWDYDGKILLSLPEAIHYPLFYWTLMSLITFIYTLPALVRKQPRLQRWKIRRSVA